MEPCTVTSNRGDHDNMRSWAMEGADPTNTHRDLEINSEHAEAVKKNEDIELWLQDYSNLQCKMEALRMDIEAMAMGIQVLPPRKLYRIWWQMVKGHWVSIKIQKQWMVSWWTWWALCKCRTDGVGWCQIQSSGPEHGIYALHVIPLDFIVWGYICCWRKRDGENRTPPKKKPPI